MIEDYSETTAELNRKITKLQGYLRKKQWLKANLLVLEIVGGLIDLSVWLSSKG